MEALSALCNGLIRPEAHRPASLVCLSNYLHGDHRHAAGSEKDSIMYIIHSATSTAKSANKTPDFSQE